MTQTMNMRIVVPGWLARCGAALLLALGAGAAAAQAQLQQNAIESITATAGRSAGPKNAFRYRLMK